MRDTSSPSSAWYDPPNDHEICECEGCHEADCHYDDHVHWAYQGCYECEQLIEDLKRDS